MVKIKFGSEEENVITKEECNLYQARKILEHDIITILGYGVQGPAQALNLRDNNIRVIIGQRKNTPSWYKALKDGWIEGQTLFDIEQACQKASIIVNLLSDAGQIKTWSTIKKYLSKGKMLVFSHGFGVTYKERTNIFPPKDIDVCLVAPKGSGRSVRNLFLQNRGINSSYAVHNNFTGEAKKKIIAYGMAIGSGYLFETTFEKEVYSDLTGERGVLMGALAGLIEAQYDVLRKNGHSPSEAFNETVEELTQSLVPLISENGMDWMYANCSTTAQRGALDWAPRFKSATIGVFNDLYNEVKSGREAQVTIDANSTEDYRSTLENELSVLGQKEVWKVGKVVRSLRSVAEDI